MPGNDLREAALIRRLTVLWTLELFNSFSLPAVLFFVAGQLGQPVGPFPFYAAVLVALLLWQGAAWWRLKLRSVRAGRSLSRGALRPFAFLKWANWVLLALLPVALAVEFWWAGRLRVFALMAGGAFYVLAILEQINYYYYQLSYDNRADWRWLLRHRRLKRASLARALEAELRTLPDDAPR